MSDGKLILCCVLFLILLTIGAKYLAELLA